jgi:aminomethyltransferase
MLRFLIQAVVTALGLWLASEVIDGVDVLSSGSLIAAAVLLGIVNALVRPILVVLSFPLTIITFGLFLLVVNASMIAEDLHHLKSVMTEEEADEIQVGNASSLTGGLAVQGPAAKDLFHRLFGSEAIYPEKNTVQLAVTPQGIMWLCGTGYTGEEGFEVFTPSSRIEHWFSQAVSHARELGGGPCGLGARDTLRLEMGYPLNGNDLAPDKTPLQAGLGFFVAMEKPDFIGKAALAAQKAAGLPSKLAAFKMIGTAPPPRPQYPIAVGGEIVGEVASGTQSPSLSTGIGMAYLPTSAAKIGTQIEIEIRGRRFPAEVVKKPFYRKEA